MYEYEYAYADAYAYAREYVLFVLPVSTLKTDKNVTDSIRSRRKEKSS